MLKKIIAIKNVGTFRNSAAPGNPQLSKHTFIVGANGYGKTTICAILRSLQTGDPSHVLGRKTLGSSGAPSIELLLETGPCRFDGRTWSAPKSAISIFDGQFVAENVHSGEIVDIEHKRNLYRVIIGMDGVKLAREDAEYAAASRAKTGEIGIAHKAIQPYVPSGMKLETFLNLAPVAGIDRLIEEQGRAVEAMRQADAIRARALLTPYPLPALPNGFVELLARTIDDIAEDAEQELKMHLAKHGLASTSGGWIATGLEHATDTCPFCGQDIRGLQLIRAFRAVFSAQHRALVDEIASMRQAVSRGLSEVVLARLDTISEQNRAEIEFWSRYCTVDPASIALPDGLKNAAALLARAALELLEKKASAPLEAIVPGTAFTVAAAAFADLRASAQTVNATIEVINQDLNNKKVAIGIAHVKGAEAELARRRAVKNRHSEGLVKLCSSYASLVAEKDEIDKRKDIVRAKLDAHTKSVVKTYEKRINAFLDAFNAGFRITETRHAYPGGVATSSYQLVINDIAVDLGDSKTPANRPCFKNTLSAGDRTTLALAFFLAHLERDREIQSKLVVFDDPFSSQDSFRRRQTVQEIMRISKLCAQVIVLSHDATFLRQAWDKAGAAERVSLTIANHRAQGSKLLPIDLEAACRGRTATDIDDLQTYLTTGAGSVIDLVRKMRVVLETHCRTTYPSSFLDTDWLGDMVRRIREGGEAHPAYGLYDELDQINDYTSEYHHGERIKDSTPDQIDPTELTGYVRRTLRVANALQA